MLVAIRTCLTILHILIYLLIKFPVLLSFLSFLSGFLNFIVIPSLNVSYRVQIKKPNLYFLFSEFRFRLEFLSCVNFSFSHCSVIGPSIDNEGDKLLLRQDIVEPVKGSA